MSNALAPGICKGDRIIIDSNQCRHISAKGLYAVNTSDGLVLMQGATIDVEWAEVIGKAKN